jgi:hypothetical protein
MKWQKSTYCADAACIEVAEIDGDFIGIRDSKRPDQPFLRFDHAEWLAFIECIKAGEIFR